jgi:hypothetical protein
MVDLTLTLKDPKKDQDLQIELFDRNKRNGLEENRLMLVYNIKPFFSKQEH